MAEVIKRTALATVFAAIALPATVYKTACRALDNDFQRSTDRTQKAGIILADVLEKGVQGNRPTVLVCSLNICVYIGQRPLSTNYYEDRNVAWRCHRDDLSFGIAQTQSLGFGI